MPAPSLSARQKANAVVLAVALALVLESAVTQTLLVPLALALGTALAATIVLVRLWHMCVPQAVARAPTWHNGWPREERNGTK